MKDLDRTVVDVVGDFFRLCTRIVSQALIITEQIIAVIMYPDDSPDCVFLFVISVEDKLRISSFDKVAKPKIEILSLTSNGETQCWQCESRH